MSDNLPGPPHLESPEPESLYVWDTSNPRSLINLVSLEIREAMLRLVNERPDLCDQDEPSLKKYVRAEVGINFTTVDNQLRFKFWHEFERASAIDGRMKNANICAMVCSVEFFKKTFLKNNFKICWMLCKPMDFMVKAEEALSFGMDELRDILELPHMDGKKIDHKMLNVKITIMKMLDARVNGAAVQRTLNYTKSEHRVIGDVSAAEKEKLIEQQIKQLEENQGVTQRVLATSQKAILPDGVDGI